MSKGMHPKKARETGEALGTLFFWPLVGLALLVLGVLALDWLGLI